MHVNRVIAVALGVVCVVCGGNKGGGTRESPVLTGISITPGTDLMMIKAVESFTATASYANSTSAPVVATWGSDTTNVATVDSSGRVTGVSSGQATIFADYQGQRGTRLLRVVPNYHGRWRGDWTVTACADDGDWRAADACREFAPGSLWALAISATQTRDFVTGTTDFGDDLPGPVSGTIRMSGHLELSGTFTVISEGITLELTVSDWETLTTDNERMTGRFRLTIRAAGLQGFVRMNGTLRIVSKTSATPLQPMRTEGPSLGQALTRILRRR